MIKELNLKLIIKVLSILLLAESFFMLSASIVSLLYKENDFNSLFKSTTITFFVGFFSFLISMNARKKAGIRESYFLITASWIVFSLFGLLPFFLSDASLSFTDAFFETMSGVTTTGSSILNNVESLSNGLLFWRSIIQWFGGMGFIVLSLAILPMLGIVGGARLLSFDSGKVSSAKLHPRIIETLKWLWIVYLVLTLAEAFSLKLAGMSFFDAFCHSFTTISTGGFSTKQNNIAFFNSSTIEYIITFFMTLSGISFILFFFFFKGKFAKIYKNEELRLYLLCILVFSLFIALGLFFLLHKTTEESIRLAFFHVVSILTTTGFFTENYMLWGSLFSTIIIILMLFGASIGSASGGIKMIRIGLVLKNNYNEFKRFIHPNAILPSRFNGVVVPLSLINNIFIFFLSYLFVVFIGVLFMTGVNLSFGDSIIIVLSTVGNIGYGTGHHLTSLQSFSTLPDAAKWFLSALMLVGRLEMFTILILFTRTFWRK